MRRWIPRDTATWRSAADTAASTRSGLVRTGGHRRGHRVQQEERARPYEEEAVEQDQERRRQQRGDDALEADGRGVGVAVESRDQIAGPLAGEEGQGEAQRVAEQVLCHVESGPGSDAPGHEEVAELALALGPAHAEVSAAEEHDEREAVAVAREPQP